MTARELQASIYRDIIDVLDGPGPGMNNYHSLFQGVWGALLYVFYYEQYGDHTKDGATGILTKLYEDLPVDGRIGYSYGMGLTGPFWLLYHLNKHEFIELEIDELTENFITNAIRQGDQMLADGNFDFINGSTGVCNFLVEFAFREDVRAHLQRFVNALQKTSRHSKQGVSLPVYSHVRSKSGVDAFSMAHGNCAPQIVLAKIHKAGIAREICREIVYGNLDYTLRHGKSLKHQNSTVGKRSLYPRAVGASSSYSRLSWCYGDLGVALSLWFCGNHFKEESWKKEALDIMRYNSSRRSTDNSGIRDACLCHGAAGVGTIYHRFWSYTKDPVFHECTAYWYKTALSLTGLSGKPGEHGTKTWSGRGKQWIYTWNILDGSSGVGLALLNQETGRSLPWDEFLLIS